MYCRNCGNEINDRAIVCIHCGCAVEQQRTQASEPVKSNVLAIVGFILAFFMPIAGLVCSIIGYKRADRDYGGNCKSLALAGTILSAIFLAVVVAVVLWAIIMWIALLAAITSPGPYPCAVLALMAL